MFVNTHVLTSLTNPSARPHNSGRTAVCIWQVTPFRGSTLITPVFASFIIYRSFLSGTKGNGERSSLNQSNTLGWLMIFAMSSMLSLLNTMIYALNSGHRVRVRHITLPTTSTIVRPTARSIVRVWKIQIPIYFRTVDRPK